MRTAWAAYRCNPGDMDFWTPFGSPWLVRIVPETREAWDALNLQLARFSYTFDEIGGGTYNCRKIAGTNLWSLHAYGIALDINPSRNPRLPNPDAPMQTDLPGELVVAIESIYASNGRQVFYWGGHFGHPDPMHFQLSATPDELAAGPISYPIEGDEDMAFLPLKLKHSNSGDKSRGSDWALLARRFKRAYPKYTVTQVPNDGTTPQSFIDAITVELGFNANLADPGVNAGMWDLVDEVLDNKGPLSTVDWEGRIAEIEAELDAQAAFDKKIKDLG